MLTHTHTLNRRTQRKVSCFINTAGPYGGSGGGAFNDMPMDNCGAEVKRINIRSGRVVDSIQFTYRPTTGQDIVTPKHGGNGGSMSQIDLDVDGGEKIIGVFGRSGNVVDQLGFVTNEGRVYGPYGENGGSSFKIANCHIRGDMGKSGNKLDSIGFYCD